MNPPAKRFPWTIAIGLLLLTFTLALAVFLAQLKQRLANRSAQPLPVYGAVTNFSLLNQQGAAVSLDDLRGHVWLGNIIFTRCPGPCLRMTRQMKELQTGLPRDSRARLVTLTTDPDFDTPEVLKTYGQHAGADFERWMFLTGTKKEIGNLAIGSLKLAAIEKKPEERESSTDLFVHSTVLVIIDRQGQLRGSFPTAGEDVDWTQTKARILAAVAQLEREK